MCRTARAGIGHMAWLQVGGAATVWEAMAAQGPDVVRLGDRLDGLLGDADAAVLLFEALRLAHDAAVLHQPAAYVRDEMRLLFARRLRHRGAVYAALQEHAALCQALAEAVRDALAHGADREPTVVTALADRCKAWERAADDIVQQARSHTGARSQRPEEVQLLTSADDIADALEEAAFVLSLTAETGPLPWTPAARRALQQLADTVCDAACDHVRAVTIAAAVASGAGDDDDEDALMGALWRLQQAERRCDDGLRSVRRALWRPPAGNEAIVAAEAVASEPANASGATLASCARELGRELAEALEAASDHLLAVGHLLRGRVLQVEGAA